MECVYDVARYILSKDPNCQMFPQDTIMTRNGLSMYKGNNRLNKYLHIMQNLYLAKYGTKLFKENLYAYVNGGIVKEIEHDFKLLRKEKNPTFTLQDSSKSFIDKVCVLLENADEDSLIEISHQDPEWKKKRHDSYDHESQKMNSEEYVDIYREKYEDALKIIDRI